jgi:hypothetical protein
MALLAPASFSSDPMALLGPGMRARAIKEAKGMEIEISYEFDKMVVSSGKHKIGIRRDVIISSFANDDYAAIDRAVVGAVRYLRSRPLSSLKRRSFRTKQRSILARRK